MKISIITVCWNSAKTIRDALESVRRQVLPEGVDLEHIVVDGNSTKDETVSIIKEYSAAPQKRGFVFRWISEPDDGLYDAMNKGVRLATGEVVGILNSDDMLESEDVVAKVSQKFAKKPGLEFLYSDVRFVSKDTTLENLKAAITQRFVCPFYWSPWMLTLGLAPPHPGMYVKKACFEKWGFYKPEYRIGADYEMTVRFLRKHGAKRAYMRKCSVAMRLGGASTEKGAAGSFVGNNYDVIKANRENGYVGSRFLILGKMPVKVLELMIPKVFRHIGA